MEIRTTTMLTPQEQTGIGGLSSALPLDHTLNVHPDMPSYFQAFENGALLGALTIFAPMSNEAELSVFVQPDHRRRGVFRALLNRAEPILRDHGFASILFPCDSKNEPGGAVAAHWGLILDHSEYFMVYGDDSAPAPKLSGLVLEPSRAQELNDLAALLTDAFGDTPEDARKIVRESLDSGHILCRTAYWEGGLAGSCCVSVGENFSIFGLTVPAPLRGRGCGRAILAALVEELSSREPEKPITLEVDSLNRPALHLYETGGFSTGRRTDYYRRGL